MSRLVANPHHNTLFLPGDEACATSVKAGRGFQMSHVILSNLPNWRTGVPQMKDKHICGLTLILRKALSDAPTEGKTLVDVVLQDEMIELMETHGMGFSVDGKSSVARTIYTPSDSSFNTLKLRTYLWRYSQVTPLADGELNRPTFIVSGVTDLKPGGFGPDHVIAHGKATDRATAEKADYVVERLQDRVKALELQANDVTQAHVYTSQLNQTIIHDHLIKAFPLLALHGVTFVDADTFFLSTKANDEPPRLTVDVSAGNVLYERWDGEGNEMSG